MAMWKLSFEVPERDAVAAEAVLDPLVAVTFVFVGERPGMVRLEGLVEEAPDLPTIDLALAAATGSHTPSVMIEQVPDRDWVAETWNMLPPLAIGRFWIHGAHVHEAPPPGLVPLEVDATIAFGTGNHPTTAGCLLALQALAGRPVRRPLDLGCGSGILALAMARLWPVPVLAIDNDPVAVAVTRDHARRNHLNRRIRARLGDGLRRRAIRRRGPFDLIVANILARPLIRMAGDVCAALAPGGVLVLSGLLDRDARWVLHAYRRRGLRLMRRLVLDGWATLVIGRRGRPTPLLPPRRPSPSRPPAKPGSGPDSRQG